MRVANIMLAEGMGGIEQAFLDYTSALSLAGHEVAVVTHPDAAVNAKASAVSHSHVTLGNRGPWDRAAPEKLRAMLRTLRAELVVTHGGRATEFAKAAIGGEMPLVAVSHNYTFKHLESVDAVLAITRHMQAALIAEAVVEASRIHVIPNMIEIKGGFIRPVWRDPPRIGALGRFVEKKGFAVLLDAFALLAERGYAFRGIIAGDGECKGALKRQARRRKLGAKVEFPGWVEDAPAFLKSVDLFCLPSLHEPFGIVLLEAMAAKLPVVTTASEGPSEIVTDGVDARVVPCGDAVALADALAALLDDEDGARSLASDAYHSVRRRYDREKVATLLSQTIEAVRERWEREPARRVASPA